MADGIKPIEALNILYDATGHLQIDRKSQVQLGAVYSTLLQFVNENTSEEDSAKEEGGGFTTMPQTRNNCFNRN